MIGVAYTSECSSCMSGTFSEDGAVECTICPANTFSHSGDPSCTRCDTNTHYSGRYKNI